MRSYSGCLTCKKRKLKCDESKPACGKCVKSSRICTYGEQSIFRTQDIGPSPARKRKRTRDQQETQSHESREQREWVDFPAEFTFVQAEQPGHNEGPTVMETSGTTAGLNASGIDGIIDTGQESEAPTSRPMSIHATPVTPSFHQTPTTSHHTPREYNSPIPCSDKPEPDSSEKLLISYLLRHFKQGPGQWMDLFDSTSYFSSKVPVIAISKPLLKSAMCALSAKHLLHICRTSSKSGSKSSFIPSYISISSSNEETWRYNSARFYDQALGHLKSAVSLDSCAAAPSDKEEILAAVAILCTFELMDAPGSAWKAHLSALPLFDDGNDSISDHNSITIPQMAIKGPIFWSLARQDLLCAFISETPTRLDLKDMRLWQNSGLATGENRELLPYSPLDMMESLNSTGFEEDMKSNELTWILGKIANHLTAGDSLVPVDNIFPQFQRPLIGLNQEHLLERWNMLMTDLDRWHDSLPVSFCATAQTRKLGQAELGFERSFDTFEQIWFDLPLCAAVIQSYHQAKILLLANEPQESTAIRSTVSARLRSYRHSLREVIVHARAVCGISLANSTEAFRANSVQALFVAGQVFEDYHEQEAVLELLAGIEHDLGWTTKYHIAKLRDEWAKGREGNHVDRNEQSHESNWFIS